MSADDDGAESTEAPTWRELAVARSLDPARARAEKRVQRFLDAALELMTSSDTKDFTVQQVVERSGQSLRSFYQYFAGKYELLLALFEESVRNTAEHLQGVVDGSRADSKARLHAFCTEYYKLCSPPPTKRSSRKGVAPAMAEFAQQLLTEHPKEATRAFAPLVSMLVQLLDEARDSGALRDGFDHQRVAGIVLQAIMFNAFAATISGQPTPADPTAAADEAWRFVIAGLGRHV